MRYVASVGGNAHTVELNENGASRQVSLDGQQFAVDWRLVGGARLRATGRDEAHADHYSVLIGTRSYDVYVRFVAAQGDSVADAGQHSIEVALGGRSYVVAVQDERTRALAQVAGGSHGSGDAAIRAPMPGLVSSVLASEGTEVTRGQTVVVLEAMKMENDLTTPRAGLVKSVRVAKGQTVNQGDVLAIIGDPAGTPPLDESEDDE